VWCWPGNTNDSALIRQVNTDMRDWSLARVVWVADRGFASAANRRFLQQAGGHYILGEKLRGGTPEADAALARQGRYAQAAGNLAVKEVNIDADDRFVICYNPEAAERDQQVRERLVAQLTDKIDGTDMLSATKRAELRGVISTKPGLNRYLRVTPGGLLRVDQAAIKAEERLDGKYLLLRSHAVGRGHRPRLQAAPGSRTRLARHEDHIGPAAGLPPARRPHPRPHPVVLARPAAHPRRGDHHRPHLGQDPHRGRASPSRRVHRPRRHVQPAHRAVPATTGDPGQAEDRRAAPRPGRHTRNRLTNPTSRPSDTPCHRANPCLPSSETKFADYIEAKLRNAGID
jgi:Transposase DDE domain